VLWRGHWLQPVPPRESPQPLLLQVGELPGQYYELEGSIEVTVNRYLHVHARLWYLDPAQLASPTIDPLEVPVELAATTPPQYMLLDDKRRMRSGLLHYLDHPKLGVLVRIDPVAVPPELQALADKVSAALADTQG